MAHYAEVEDALGALNKRVGAIDQIEKSITELGNRDAKAMQHIDAMAGNLHTLAVQIAKAREQSGLLHCRATESSTKKHAHGSSQPR